MTNELREMFREKWANCAGLEELRFPFNDDGAWIGYQDVEPMPEETGPEPESIDERTETAALNAEINELFVSGSPDARAYASEMVGCDGRPPAEKAEDWLGYYDVFMKMEQKKPADEQADDGKPDFTQF